MGNYNKWNRGEAVTDPSTPVYVVLFVSRNKDNQHLENFHERRNAFVTTQTVEQLQNKFQAFVHKENAYGDNQKWLFDFDPIEGEDTDELLHEFVKDVQYEHEHTKTKRGQTRPQMNIEVHKTVNGYAVLVDQRFDTRALLGKWTNVELKRDDQLCVAWDTKS